MRYKRDARTGAAILCDSEAVNAYLLKKTQQEQIQALQRQINTLQEQVLELQQHLLKDKQSE
jgi:hypothetical protein